MTLEDEEAYAVDGTPMEPAERDCTCPDAWCQHLQGECCGVAGCSAAQRGLEHWHDHLTGVRHDAQDHRFQGTQRDDERCARCNQLWQEHWTHPSAFTPSE